MTAKSDLARHPGAGTHLDLPRLLALASGGVVVGHVLAYWLVAPAHAHRSDLLAATGHSYWPSAVAAAVVATGWAVVDHISREIRATMAPSARSRPAGRVAGRLIAAQVGGFAVVEVSERLIAGETDLVHSLVHEGVLPVGLLAQVAVAAVLAVLVAWLGRAAVALARRFTRTPRPSSRRPRRWSFPAVLPPPTRWWRVQPIRGPPQVSLRSC
jgi:hypothetical protein